MDNLLKAKLEDYKVPTKAVELIKEARVVFLVGTSGAGKDTVCRALLETGDYHYIVSHTTRQPRSNHGIMEQEGVDYHFIDLAKAEEMLGRGEFVEAKMFSGNIYGTSIEEIQKAHDTGKIAISEIEVQGIAEYKAISDSIIPIFLLPPGFETWQERLSKRYDNQVDPEDIKRRMNTAKVELQEALEKPYFEYVINNDLSETVSIVDSIARGEHSDKKNERARHIAQDMLKKL